MSASEGIHKDLLEQVMRACTSDNYVIPFLTSAPNSKEFMLSLGKLLEHNPSALVANTPLTAYSPKDHYRKDWRSVCSQVSNSVWSELELHESVGVLESPADCPMLRLLQFRGSPSRFGPTMRHST